MSLPPDLRVVVRELTIARIRDADEGAPGGHGDREERIVRRLADSDQSASIADIVREADALVDRIPADATDEQIDLVINGH